MTIPISENGIPICIDRSIGTACYILLVSLSDTSTEAAAIQLRLLREMTGEQRLRLAFELSDLAQEITKAGIRRDHPEWSEREVNREWLRQCFFPKPLPPGL